MILVGDAIEQLATRPEKSVHCCVTSPPYWMLRDYGVDGQIGLEATPEEYIAKMVEVFRAVWRVLRDDGTLWLNVGDSYASGGGAHGGRTDNQRGVGARVMHDSGAGDKAARTPPPGLKPKDLVGIPWMLAFALRADGWYLRSEIIWHKSNPMPESCRDRPTKSHEQMFLLTKRPTYYYDQDAIREEHAPNTVKAFADGKGTNARAFGKASTQDALGKCMSGGMASNDNGAGRFLDPRGANKRTVWTIPTFAYPKAHFATFPPALVEPCILAGTSAKGCCPECGAPWKRVVERSGYSPPIVAEGVRNVDASRGDKTRKLSGAEYNATASVVTTGWTPTCDHEADPVPAVVLDPFAGSGTVGQVAREHGRDYLLVELNPEYVEQIKERLAMVQPPLLTEVAT